MREIIAHIQATHRALLSSDIAKQSTHRVTHSTLMMMMMMMITLLENTNAAAHKALVYKSVPRLKCFLCRAIVRHKAS